jgi:DNA-binding NarL/FixJ family response regulator
MTDPIRILIVASHAAVREDMRTVLQLADGVEVTGEASNRAEALWQAQVLHPDAVLVDLEMPAQSGYAILAEIKIRKLAGRVIALTAHEYPAARAQAVRCGADAVIIKGANLDKMLAVIQNKI